MSLKNRSKLSWLTILLLVLAFSSLACGISNVRSLPADPTISDVAFTLLISGDVPIIVFLLGAIPIVASRQIRKREPLVVQSVRHHVEAQSPSVTIRRVRIVGEANGSQTHVLVQHGLAPPLYSLYQVDQQSQVVTHCQDSTLPPPGVKLTA